MGLPDDQRLQPRDLAPSGILASSYTNYTECVKKPPDWAFVDGNSVVMENEVHAQFTDYSKLIPAWVAQIARLKSSPVTRRARAKLVAAEGLHAKELAAWQGAAAAIKAHQCESFLGYLKQAQRAGAPDLGGPVRQRERYRLAVRIAFGIRPDALRPEARLGRAALAAPIAACPWAATGRHRRCSITGLAGNRLPPDGLSVAAQLALSAALLAPLLRPRTQARSVRTAG